MKKIIAICLALVMMAGLATLVCSAGETDTTIKYGNADVDLVLIDDMSGEATLQGYPYGDKAWGVATLGNGELFITADQGMFDFQDFQTGNLTANGDLGAHTNIVFKVLNTSDGDIRFTFQPRDIDNPVTGAATTALYLSAALAANDPVKLVSLDGTAVDAEFYPESSYANTAGRDTFKIPYEFEGYIVIPNKALATTMNGTTSAFPDGTAVYEYYGFNVTPDDATYVELAVQACYSCADLPACTPPVAETTTGEQVTKDPFADITTTEEQITTTDDVVDETTTADVADDTTTTKEDTTTTKKDTTTTKTTTKAETTTGEETTTEEAGGCGSVIGGAVIVMAMAAGVAVCTKKRHH